MIMNWKTIEYERVDSTNIEARRLISKGEGEGLVVRAQHQVSGRGRRGRTWWNLPGKSILASFVFEDIDSNEATRVVSTSTIAAIRNNKFTAPLIKWPNDLVYKKKKAGGILSESFNKNSEHYTIVGLGLNLNYTNRELILGKCLSATSLMIETGKSIDSESLLGNIIEEIDKRLSKNRETNLAEYKENLAFLGKEISLVTENSKSKGIFTGVDDRGFLQLQSGDVIDYFSVGDVRKVNI